MSTSSEGEQRDRDTLDLERYYALELEKLKAERLQAVSALECERLAWADERRALLGAFQRQIAVGAAEAAVSPARFQKHEAQALDVKDAEHCDGHQDLETRENLR